jgi:hypothetical protein
MKPPRVMTHKLSMKQAHALVSLMLDNFTDKCMTYADYAKFATDSLGFEVTPQHVKIRATEFAIPSGNKVPVPDSDIASLAAMLMSHQTLLTDLQERITRLEGWVNTTFPSKGPLRAVS